MIIKEIQDRNKLAEGRSCGMAFGFVINISENYYETVTSLSPCKDFLNEPIFTELSGFASKAHGLDYTKKLNIFEKECLLGIKIFKTKSDTFSPRNNLNFEQCVELLNNNYKNVEKFLNYFEEKLELEDRTIITQCEDNYFLVKFPKDFIISTIAISLYTLLLRVAMFYDGILDPIEYLKLGNFGLDDKSLVNTAMPSIEVILNNKRLPKQPKYTEGDYKYSPHDKGICSWNKKYEE